MRIREYGTAMLAHLRGMFTFALWTRARSDSSWRATTLASSRSTTTGTVPLRLRSELKARDRASGGGAHRGPECAGPVPRIPVHTAPHSVYRDVRKLEAGSALTIENGDLQTWQYWRPDYSDKIQCSESEAKVSPAHGVAQFGRAHAGRRRSARQLFFPAASISSLVSALMVGHHGQADRKHSTWVSTARRRKASTPGRTGVAPHRQQSSLADAGIRLTCCRPFGRWSDAFDEPFADPAALPTMLLAELARKNVTVVLTGEGADEVFSGYDNYRKRVSEERVSGILGSRYSPVRHLLPLLPGRLRKTACSKPIGEPLPVAT